MQTSLSANLVRTYEEKRKRKRKEKTMLLSVIKEKLMVNLSFPLA